MRSLASAFLLLPFLLLAGSCDEEDRGDCPTGSAGCACTAGGGCDPGLSCNAGGLCVSSDGTGTVDAGDGTPDTLTCQSTSPCWDACSSHYTSCASDCGVGDGVSCWQRCTSHHTSCATTCGTETPCAAVLCWESCTSHYTTCESDCGVSQVVCESCAPAKSARDMCWDACTSHHTVCAETCGT